MAEPKARPRWQVVAGATIAGGVLATSTAVATVAVQGVTRPTIFGVGTAACLVVNYIYVTVVRRGVILEALDLSEAPLVALALLLPPAEALVAFVAGSALGEIFRRAAAVKRAFNVSVRAVGAAVFLAVSGHVGLVAHPGPSQIIVTVAGAAAYTVVTAMVVAAVAGLAAERPILAGITDDLSWRLVVWIAAVGLGLAAADLTLNLPSALPGLVAPMAVLWLTTRAARQADLERHRLEQLLRAGEELQEEEDIARRKDILVQTAETLLIWRDVDVREEPPTSSEIGVPITPIADDGRSPWLVAARRQGSDPWSPDDTRALTTLAGVASTALKQAHTRAELAQQASVDPLTGVANRRVFQGELDRAVERVPVTVLLIDLDRFKQVNDELGHHAGDELLRVVADRIRHTVRATDLVARLGGDEFVVLMPGMSNPTTVTAISRALGQALAQPVRVGGLSLVVTASIGAATSPVDATDSDGLLRRADEAMYEAKAAGRRSRGELDLRTARGATYWRQIDLPLDTSTEPGHDGDR
ncbi:MAG TPA: sensor domain-containing diguanylate cyclase [Acidimicrobiales bacterium]|nr:sensor domain-containing diguanylate cyclase [Acidimicrobiales bacterium]